VELEATGGPNVIDPIVAKIAADPVPRCTFRSKLDGAVYLSIERFCAVEGDGKELAKLWVWMKTTEQTPFLASVSEAHESDYACMRHRRGHAGDAVSNTRSTC
jgi:hypothetical protein